MTTELQLMAQAARAMRERGVWTVREAEPAPWKPIPWSYPKLDHGAASSKWHESRVRRMAREGKPAPRRVPARGNRYATPEEAQAAKMEYMRVWRQRRKEAGR